MTYYLYALVDIQRILPKNVTRVPHSTFESMRLTLAFSGRGKMVERHGVHDPEADADRVR